MAIEPIKGFYVHDEESNTDGVAQIALDAIEGVIQDDIAPAVTNWLDDHPEATTTVQDGAIATAKLADGSVTPTKTSFDFQTGEIWGSGSDSYGASVLSLATARKTRASNVIRVATYNTPTRDLLGAGYDALDFPTWFSCLTALNGTGADVVMLQEITSMNPYTVDVLYPYGGAFPYAYMPIYKRGDISNSDDLAVSRRNYGNAIVSAYPFTNTGGGIFAYTPSYETRGYANAKITFNGKTVSFYSTHFSLDSTQRATEIGLFKTVLQNDNSNIVMFGADTNIYYANQATELADIISLGFTALNAGQNTYPSGALDRSIDNIYIKGNYTKVADGVIDYTEIADFDHACYYADLQIGG